MAGQHQQDKIDKVPHHPDGGCLNRHVGGKPCDTVGNVCSHRWQAYEKMKDTATSLYDWPRYRSLADEGKRRRTARMRGKSGNLFPKYYRTFLDPPGEGDWNVAGNNFFMRAYEPYWHEAHHIVPNSTLAGAIANVGEGAYTIVIRCGLAGEKYNLNDKKNMVMLPMDRPVSAAMRLPRHRQTAAIRSHGGYSKHVAGRVQKILNPLEQQLKNHEPREYESVKAAIEALSEELFSAVTTSVAGSLDDMKPSELAPAPKTSQF
jgi:hypothetical protein